MGSSVTENRIAELEAQLAQNALDRAENAKVQEETNSALEAMPVADAMTPEEAHQYLGSLGLSPKQLANVKAIGMSIGWKFVGRSMIGRPFSEVMPKV